MFFLFCFTSEWTIFKFCFQHCLELAAQADVMLEIANPATFIHCCCDSSPMNAMHFFYISKPPLLPHISLFPQVCSPLHLSLLFYSVEPNPICSIRVNMADSEAYDDTSGWKWTFWLPLCLSATDELLKWRLYVLRKTRKIPNWYQNNSLLLAEKVLRMTSPGGVFSLDDFIWRNSGRACQPKHLCSILNQMTLSELKSQVKK